MFISFVFTYSCFPIPLSLPTDSQSHTLSVFLFLTHGDDSKVIFLILANFFLIYFLEAYIVIIFFPVQSNTG